MIDKNKKILVLVESPNKTKSVSSILKSLGYENIKVLATIGHTTKIKDVKGSYKNTGIYPNENFKTTYVVAEDKFKVVQNIKEQAKWADLVLIASDPDREGENLGNHIKELLKLKDNNYYRIKYHSITKEAIKEAMEHPTKMDTNLCDAAEARQIIDKLIGYSLSPIAKTYIGARSVGRCQSIGLKFVVDREKEIQDFIPEKYIDLYLDFKKNNTTFKAKYVGTDEKLIEHLKTEDEVKKIKKECNSNFIVKNVEKYIKQESPKPPFCTATFQQEAASKIGLKIKDAMSCAQKLFEAGKITYHRSDSLILSDEFVAEAKVFIDAVFPGLFKGAQKFKKMEGEQGAHEAIRPTDPTLTPDLFAAQESNKLLVKVYKLIWQRTIQSMLIPATIEIKKLIIKNNIHLFSTEFKHIKTPGFKELD